MVVYDRIREMFRKYKKLDLPEVIDIAINSTLSRTVITATTTFLAMLAMSIFGGEVLRSFSLAMLFGIVIGTYSSIFHRRSDVDLSRIEAGRGRRREGAGQARDQVAGARQGLRGQGRTSDERARTPI